MTQEPHIALIGFGKMGEAIYQGWRRANLQARITIISPNNEKADYKTPQDAAQTLQSATTILLAVKPQIMEEVCAQLKPHIAPETLIISVAAGQDLANYTHYFGKNRPVIRAMPNTPSTIGKGITICVANQKCTPDHKATATTLMQPTGMIDWIEDDALMNAVTAISGSGPAYVFYFIEALSIAATQAGLPKALAQTLARHTVIGSAALAEHESTLTPEALRQNVTSPGGTTEAALSKLMDGEFQEILNEAINKAIKRGEEL